MEWGDVDRPFATFEEQFPAGNLGRIGHCRFPIFLSAGREFIPSA